MQDRIDIIEVNLTCGGQQSIYQPSANTNDCGCQMNVEMSKIIGSAVPCQVSY